MWRRLVPVLRCPVCAEPLQLRSLSEKRISIGADDIERARRREVLTDDFDVYVDAGLLRCAGCCFKFPIVDGLPVMLPYKTPLHDKFDQQWKSQTRKTAENFCYPSLKPVTGEEFVARSFSSEWLAYEYDGVIWDLSYEAHT